MKTPQVMSGSTIINQRQHVGLQRLSALAGTTLSFLGPQKMYKFVQDEASGEAALVGSCVRALENLEQTCAVAQLVRETVRAHHNVYRTGSGCLLFLAGAWSRAALECLRRGISASHIVTAMSEGMELCLDVCGKCSLPTEGPGVAPGCSGNVTCHVPQTPAVGASQGTAGVGQKASAACGQRKIKLSRHFCQSKSESVPLSQRPEPPDAVRVAEGLSHGCAEAMNLVVEVGRIQSRSSREDGGCSSFDVAKVMTCVLPGLPEERAHASPGCVVLLNAEQASVALRLTRHRLNVALIHGDVSHGYRHLGFNRLKNVQRVCGQSDLPGSSGADVWMGKVSTLLLKLEVKLVLASGLVDEDVLRRFAGHDILVVGKVKASALKAFADATGAVLVTYATQLNKHCVGCGTKVVIWRELGTDGRTSCTAVNICTSGNTALCTAVITSSVHGKLQALEDRFWACAHRLHHALRDKALLPGGGVTEMLCVRRLRKEAGRGVERRGERTGAAAASNPYREAVLQLMADGLVDYVSAVAANARGISKVKARTAVSRQLQEYDEGGGVPAELSQAVWECEAEGPAASVIYDNLSVKQEAWRKALDLVLLVLQTDAEVITRAELNGDGAHADLMLL